MDFFMHTFSYQSFPYKIVILSCLVWRALYLYNKITERRESKAGRICGEAEMCCATATKHFLIIAFERTPEATESKSVI